MKYHEFLTLVKSSSSYFNWRYGQALMNVLHGLWPEKYNELTQSNIDPYYRDDVIPQVLKLLEQDWNPTNDKF